MRAVNLIPSDSRRGPRSASGLPGGPAFLVLGALGVVLLLVTVYVLTGNTVSDRKAQLASLQTRVAQEQTEATQLAGYAQFAKLAQARVETVREIASSRFDWHSALSDLSKVVPANTSLQSLFASVAPGASVSGAVGGGGGITGGLRGDEPGPAFEMTGCTSTQDDVARLMSRLRLINGVSRVSLADSQKLEAPQQGTNTSGASAGSGTGSSTPVAASGCPGGWPKFDLVIFFNPLPGAGPNGLASANAVSSGGAK